MTGLRPGNACSPAAGKAWADKPWCCLQGLLARLLSAGHSVPLLSGWGHLHNAAWTIAARLPQSGFAEGLLPPFSADLQRRACCLIRSWGEGFLYLSFQPLLRIAATARSTKSSAVSSIPPDISYMTAPVILLCICLRMSVLLCVTWCFSFWCRGSWWEEEIIAFLLCIWTDLKSTAGQTDLGLADLQLGCLKVLKAALTGSGTIHVFLEVLAMSRICYTSQQTSRKRCPKLLRQNANWPGAGGKRVCVL